MNRLERSTKEKKRRLKKMFAAGIVSGIGGGAASCVAPMAGEKIVTATAKQPDIADVMADYTFKKVNDVAFFRNDSPIYLRPYEQSEIMTTAIKKEPIRITGIGTRGFWEAERNNIRCYVKTTDVVTDVSIIDQGDIQQAEVTQKKENAIENYTRRVEEEAKEKEIKKLKAKQEAQKKKEKEQEKELAKLKKEKAEAEEKIKAYENRRAGNIQSGNVQLSQAYVNATSNTQKIWIYLTEHGFSDVQAAGIMGNIQCESGFNPRATDGGHGLFQWIGGRRKRLYAYTSDPWSIEGQLSFMIHELNTSESGTLSKLRSASTPAQAAYIWDTTYERSAGLSRAKRMSCAEAWYRVYHKSDHKESTNVTEKKSTDNQKEKNNTSGSDDSGTQS